jgi:hypothetical protein
MAAKAAEVRDLASDVPDSIFGFFGSSLMAIPPIDAVPASADTTWHTLDTLGHTIPLGTYVGIRNTAGDLIAFQTVADVIIAPGDNVTATGGVSIRAVDGGIGGNGLSNVPELIDVLDWVTTIDISAPTGGGVDAETNDDYLNRLTKRLQLLSQVPIIPSDFALAAGEADPGVFRAIGIDGYNPFHNLLTANESDAETDAAGWINLANSTISSSSAQHANGAKSVGVTSVASGDMNAILNREVPITPGQTVTGLASVRSAVSVRSCKVGIRFVDASHVNIGSITYGSAVNDSTSAFTALSVVAVAPVNAAYFKLVLFVTATGGAAELHYFDKMSLRHGTGTDWVVGGGTAETNNARTITVAAVDSAGSTVSSLIKTAIHDYIAARREVNFIINVMDANYTNIDVAATVVLLTGYDATTVHGDVVTAINNYLSPANWGIDPTIAGSDAATSWVERDTVYYNELVALVSGVTGVDRVSALTLNVHGGTPATADVSIAQPAALTTAGTVTCV